ncbi:AMP-binding protein [Myxococcota bacterium]|nr:AMP-binding protein [Myxococcota bacterium]
MAFDYHAHGLIESPARPAIPGDGPQTVAELLDAFVALEPDREALVGRDGRYTYAELDEAVNRVCATLGAMGVRSGDRVAASLVNSASIIVAFLGVLRMGAIWVGINRALAPPEKAYLLTDSGASVFLGDGEMVGQLERLRGEISCVQHWVRSDPGDASSEWAQRISEQDGATHPRAEIDPFAPAAIAYTSGTTGFPKGAVHSQHNILLPGASALIEWSDGGGFRTGVCLPLTLLNLMVLGPALVYQAGGCVVAMDRVDAVGLAQWIREERVQGFSSVPAIMNDLLTHPDVSHEDLSSLERPGVGGAECPESTRLLYRQRYGREVTIGYGLTEAPTSVTHTESDRERVPGSCGVALPFVSVSVRGGDGEELPVGEVGEVCVEPARDGRLAGIYTPMLGYWNRPEATEKALRGGLLNTDDLGHFDSAGNLYIDDRRSDLILRGGANVYPAEVERVLMADERVVACAVLGVPDERLGERVVGVVQLEPGSRPCGDDLLSQCAEQLARYKVPERLLVVDAFPRTPMGKIRKRDLVKLFDPVDGNRTKSGAEGEASG